MSDLKEKQDLEDPVVVTPVGRVTSQSELAKRLPSMLTASHPNLRKSLFDSKEKDEKVIAEECEKFVKSKWILEFKVDGDIGDEDNLLSTDVFPLPPFILQGSQEKGYSLCMSMSVLEPSNDKRKYGVAKLPSSEDVADVRWRITTIDAEGIAPLAELTRILFALDSYSCTYRWTKNDLVQLLKREWSGNCPREISDIILKNVDISTIFRRIFMVCMSNTRVMRLKDALFTLSPHSNERFDDFLSRAWMRYSIFSELVEERSAVSILTNNYLTEIRVPVFAAEIFSMSKGQKDFSFVSVMQLYRSLVDAHVVEPPPVKQLKKTKERICFNCQGKGHVAKECRKPKKEDTKGKVDSQKPKTCSFCKKEGHLEKNCFKKKNLNKNKEKKKEKEEEVEKVSGFLIKELECFDCGAVGHEKLDCVSYDDPKVASVYFSQNVEKISSADSSNNLVSPCEKLGILEIWANDSAFTGVLDSACQRSCMTMEDVKKLDLTIQRFESRKPIQVLAFGGTHKLDHYVTTQIRLAPFTEPREFSFLVSYDKALIPVTLLGLDFQAEFVVNTSFSREENGSKSREYFCASTQLVLGSDSILRMPYESEQLSSDAKIDTDELETSELSPDVILMEDHCGFNAPSTNVARDTHGVQQDSSMPLSGKGARWNDGVLLMEENLKPLGLEDYLRKKFGKILHELGEPQELVDRPDWELKINLSTDRKIIMPPRRMSQSHRRLVSDWLKVMLESDRIEPSVSKKYLNHLAFPKKPNGETRICLDPTLLNRYTVPMLFSGMCADDVRSSIPHDSKFYSVIDLKDAFWQLVLAIVDREKTTFYTPFGLFQFKCMPFGLTDSSRLFSSWILHLCRDLPFVVPYLDDLIICSRTEEEHVQHMGAILNRLKQEKVRISVSKLQLGQTEVRHLGLILKPGSIRLREETVLAIDAFDVPKSRTNLRSFLGLCRWVVNFVPELAVQLKPLNRLTSEKVPFLWTRKLTNQFLRVKRMLKHHITIQIPNPNLPYTIVCDASNIGFGAALLQEGRICGLYSKPWNDTQLKWPTIEQEAFAIVQSFGHWRDLLVGSTITVETDHKPLIWLAESVSSGGGSRKTHRWFCSLLPYRYRLIHRPGRFNELADALSRNPNEVDSSDFYFVQHEGNADEDEMLVMVSLSMDDLDLKKLSEDFHVWKSIHRSWTATGAEMWKRRHDWDVQLTFTKKQVFLIAKQMWQDCELCQSADAKPLKTELLPTPIPSWCGDVWAVDLKDIKSLGIRRFKYALVLVDYLSKYVVIVGLSNKKAETVKKVLEVYWLYPFRPTSLTFDGGGEFDNLLLEQFLFENEVISHRTTAKHHESNGLVEVMIREVHRSLRHFDFKITKDGEIILASIASFLNYRVHSGLKLSPAALMLGRSRLPLKEPISVEEMVKTRMRDLTQLRHDEAKNKIRMKEAYDRKHDVVPVPKVGVDSQVLLHNLDGKKKKFEKHANATVLDQQGKKLILEVDNKSKLVERSIDHVSLKKDSSGLEEVEPEVMANSQSSIKKVTFDDEPSVEAPKKNLPSWIPDKFRESFRNLLTLEEVSVQIGPQLRSNKQSSLKFPYLDTTSEVGDIIDYRTIKKGNLALDRLLFLVQWKEAQYSPEWVDCKIGRRDVSSEVLKEFISKQ